MLKKIKLELTIFSIINIVFFRFSDEDLKPSQWGLHGMDLGASGLNQYYEGRQDGP